MPDHQIKQRIGPVSTRLGEEFYHPAGAPLRPTCAPNYERRLIYYSALAGALVGTLLGLAAAWVWSR